MPPDLDAEIKAYRLRAAAMRANAAKLKDGEMKRQIIAVAETLDNLAATARALRSSGNKLS